MSAVKSVMTLSTATFLAQALVFVFSIVLAETIGPADFGVFSVFVSWGVILVALMTFSLEFGIPNLKKVVVARLNALIVQIIIIAGLIVLLSSFVMGYHYFLILPLYLTGLGLIKLAQKNMIRDGRFTLQSLQRLTPPSLILLVGVILILNGVTEVSYFISLVSVVYVVTGILFTAFSVDIKWSLSLASQRKVHLLFREEYIKGSYLTLSNLLNALTYNLPVIIIDSLIGSSMAGQFSFVMRSCFAPVSSLGSVIGSVMHNKFASLYRSNEFKKLYALYKRVLVPLVGLAFLVLLMLVFVYPVLMDFAFGEKWQKASEFGVTMAPMFAVMMLVSPFSVLFYVLNLQKYELINQLIYFSISLICFSLLFIGVDLITSIVMFVFLVTLRYLFLFAYLWKKTLMISRVE